MVFRGARGLTGMRLRKDIEPQEALSTVKESAEALPFCAQAAGEGVMGKFLENCKEIC